MRSLRSAGRCVRAARPSSTATRRRSRARWCRRGCPSDSAAGDRSAAARRRSSGASGCRVCIRRRKWKAPRKAPTSLAEAMTVTALAIHRAPIESRSPRSPARSRSALQPRPAMAGTLFGVPTTHRAIAIDGRGDSGRRFPAGPCQPRRSSSAREPRGRETSPATTSAVTAADSCRARPRSVDGNVAEPEVVRRSRPRRRAASRPPRRGDQDAPDAPRDPTVPLIVALIVRDNNKIACRLHRSQLRAACTA